MNDASTLLLEMPSYPEEDLEKDPEEDLEEDPESKRDKDSVNSLEQALPAEPAEIGGPG